MSLPRLEEQHNNTGAAIRVSLSDGARDPADITDTVATKRNGSPADRLRVDRMQTAADRCAASIQALVI